MKLRCDLHINGGSRKLVLVPSVNETAEHIAIKMAAYLLFWEFSPVVAASAKHPALAGQEFIPDLMALDESGAIRLWVECGSATMHKLEKLTKRLPDARLVVLKSSEREAQRLRADLKDQLDREYKIQILSWPADSFKQWMEALQEKTEVYGETSERMLNIVINERPVVVEFKAY